MNDEMFRFSYTDPEFSKLRVFLGNGYQNIECSNNLGQGIGVCEYHKAPFPVLKLAGVYSYPPRIIKDVDHPRLDSLFRGLNTFGLLPLDHGNKNHPTGSNMDFYNPPDFHQVLDMKRALVKTTAKIGTIDTVTEMFLSRVVPNVGFLKMEIVKDNDTPLTLKHYVRKDPFTNVDDITFLKHDNNICTFIIKTREDYNEFKGLGPSCIVQATAIQVLDEQGGAIPFSTRWDGERIDDPGNNSVLSYDEVLNYIEEITVACPERSDDGRFRWTVVLYFGIFKKMDECDPFFKKVTAGNDLVSRAVGKLAEVMHNGYEEGKDRHVRAWENDVWKGLIEVGMNDGVQKMIISSFYILGCTYLAGLCYGNGPGGVIGHPWDGRTFWDHDLWVNLGMILWAPEMARNFNLFRLHTLDGAIRNRDEYIHALKNLGVVDRLGLQVTQGARYPWESTSSGLERCPHAQGTGATKQEHINCDVIHGTWLQWLVTRDQEFLETVAYPVSYHAALYLGQRIQKEKDGLWHFRYILPADEFAEGGVDDNAFTNLYVDKCLRIVINWSKKLGKEYPKHWDDVIGNIKYHVNNDENRIIEHEEYDGETIKQADTNLITWPLEHPAVYGENGDALRRNNMLYYFAKLPENHIMMSACIFSIIAVELGMMDKATEYFKDQFPHFHPDQSYIPSEQPINDCWPFITGIGGFLSNLIYGFGGIRLRDDGLLLSPRLPGEMTRLTMPRIKFQGRELRYDVIDGGNRFTLTNLSTSSEFTIYCRSGRLFIPVEQKTPLFQTGLERSEVKYTVNLETGIEVEFQFQDPGST